MDPFAQKGDNDQQRSQGSAVRRRGRHMTSEALRQSSRNERYTRSVQIRKKRKEEQLQKRRGIRGTGNVSNQPSNTVSDVELFNYLNEFLAHGDGHRLSIFQQALATQVLSSSFLQKLIDTDGPKARQLVHALSHQLATACEVEDPTLSTVLAVLQDLSAFSVLAIDGSAEQSSYDQQSSYYGRAPLRWCDVIMDEDGLIDKHLIALLSISNLSIREMVSNILGNLVQDDSARALKPLTQAWPALVAALPSTAFCCSSIIRSDATSYAKDFLKSLTTSHLTRLFQNDDTQTHAAWMLAGLSSREDVIVTEFCQDDALIDVLIQKLYVATNAPNNEMSYFLVPALRAIGNLVAGCNGQFTPRFLVCQPFVSSICRLLDISQLAGTGSASSFVVTETLYVVQCLFRRSGTPSHLSTTVAIPSFLPLVVTVLTSGLAPMPWKVEAAFTIQTAIEYKQGGNNEMDKDLDEMAKIYLCNPSVQDDLILALIGLIRLSDMDGVLSGLYILDRILRIVPTSRELFESLSGVEYLEQICVRADVGSSSNNRGSFDDLEFAANIAAELLDDLFEGNDDEEEAMDLAPAIEGGQFVFGTNPQVHIQSSSMLSPASSGPTQGRGRGRGMTVPAWMQSHR